MSSPFKIAIVAAAIGVVAVVGIDVLPRGPDIGAAPAPSPSPTPSPVALTGQTELDAGTTYYMDNAGGFVVG